MTIVSREAHRRAVLVAAFGVFAGVLSQASLIDATVSAHPSAKSVAGDLKRTCAPFTTQLQGPRTIAPAFSQGAEMARLDVRTATK